MKGTITINVDAKIKGGVKFMKLRFWIGTRLMKLAEFVMLTEVEVTVQDGK